MTTACRRPPIRLAACGLLLLAVPLLGAGEALSGGEKDVRLGVPEGRPVQLDGIVTDAEWAPAVELPLGDGTATLRLMQFRGTLLLAFQSTLPWPPGRNLDLHVAPEGAAQGTRSPGALSIQYEPFAHDRAHLQVFHNGPEGMVRIVDRAVVRSVSHEQGCSLEMAFQLDLLGLTKEKRPPLRFCAYWPHPSAKGLTWPAGLVFRSKPGSPPPAMASVKDWGALEGWGDPTLPGAFSKSDWDAWIEHDREVRNLAQGAYGAYRLLEEEWKATRKQDAVIEAEILDPLAELGRLEPLTASDLLARAKTLRFLNRHDRALGIYDALVHHPNRVAGLFALYERAMTNGSAERYAAAAEDWDTMAERRPQFQARYAKEAEKARGLHARWKVEQERRAACAAAGDLPRVELHTPHGVILIELYEKDVPNAVKQFLELVERKFYDGTRFHRVHGEFMAQGGKGTSPPTIEVELNERHGFWRGAVGFANRSNDPRNGSQFFIMTAPDPDLGKYTCFGYVVAGQAAADRLSYDDELSKAVVVRASQK